MTKLREIAGIITGIITLVLATQEILNLIEIANVSGITEANPIKLALILLVGVIFTALCVASSIEQIFVISFFTMGVICICHEIYFGIICWIVEEDIWGDITNTAYGWIRIVAGLVIGGISIWFGWFIEVFRRG